LHRPMRAGAMVLEMGISMPGEMAKLIEIAPPEIAVLARLSPVHAANFSSFGALVREKRRLLVGREGSKPELAVVHVESMRAVAPIPTRAVTYGLVPNADVFATDIVTIPPRQAGGRP